MLWTDSIALAENPQSLAIARLLGYSGHVRADTLGGNADEAPETALDVFLGPAQTDDQKAAPVRTSKGYMP